MLIEMCRATPGEVHRALPGDELVPEPIWSATHAITIVTFALSQSQARLGRS
jgi:hypothetical protein